MKKTKTPEQLLEQCNRIGHQITKGRRQIPAADAVRLVKVNNIYWGLLDKLR